MYWPCAAPRFNILVIGQRGAGKTSLINAWMTALSNGPRVLHPLTHGLKTSRIRYYRMSSAVALLCGDRVADSAVSERYRFNVVDTFDCFGSTGDGASLLGALLDGALPSGWSE
jgi:GTPase SAR1 family protein